jgi:hypothetical protein
VLRGVGRLHLDGDDRGEQLRRRRVDEQRRVLRTHAAEADEDLVDLARVGARVQQRPRVAAPRIVAHHDREPPQPLRARRRRRRHHGEQREKRELGGPTHLRPQGFANVRTNCSPGRSRLGMRARLPPDF